MTDAVQYNEGMFLWGMLHAWDIQEHYQVNYLKNDPYLTGLMVRRMMVHSGENSLKSQLALVGNND